MIFKWDPAKAAANRKSTGSTSMKRHPSSMTSCPRRFQIQRIPGSSGVSSQSAYLLNSVCSWCAIPSKALRCESSVRVLRRAMSGDSMKKASKRSSNGMSPEYDFASMKGGVRGKYVKRLRAGSNLVLLEPDVAAAFPSDAAVNQALRAALDVASAVKGPSRVPGTRLKRTNARVTPRVKNGSRRVAGR
jgi:hypothetical protein